ncbi:MAG: type II toxin-antitoxin system RelE/ParE family toxin [Gammaproteobacteria bacterium]|nr:type II toxin-antitoxin system RelE/ParE family toxin [Gammaproteobacteria bacterium]
MEIEKEIRWMGSAYADLLEFPEEPKRQAGFQLGMVQAGLEPRHWKPFSQIGIGVKELRINVREGAFRVIYTDRFDDSVYVMHCFRKTTQVTTQRDKEIAAIRFRAITHDRTEPS